jgi:hypothetical protein
MLALVRLRKPSRLLVAIAAIVATMGYVAVADLFGHGQPPPPGGFVVPQDASASSAGVTLHLVEAAFSGTETMLTFDTQVDGQPDTPRVRISPDGLVASELSGAWVKTLSMSPGGLLVELPPMAAPGQATIEISAVDVWTDKGPVRREGEWRLVLAGPSAEDFVDIMRVERFKPAQVNYGGQLTEVSGERSVSRTVVHYDTPEGYIELAPPALVTSSGERILPLIHGPAGDSHEAIFAPTAFGETVSVEFGPFTVSTGEGAAAKIDLRRALDRQGAKPGPGVSVAIEPGDIIEGDPELVRSASFAHDVASMGNHGGDYIRISATEAWLAEENIPADASDPRPYTPKVYDAEGHLLELDGVTTSFPRNERGEVSDGTSDIDVYIKGADLSTLTLVLPGGNGIVRGDWVADLVPQQ